MSACAHYTGSARDASFPPDGPAWVTVEPFRGVYQKAQDDCGPAALAAVLRYWGRTPPPLSATSGGGATAKLLRDSARSAGLRSYLVAGTRADLLTELRARRPSVVGLFKNYGDKSIGHYEVVVAINSSTEEVVTFDPAAGFRRNSFDGFEREWVSAGNLLLVVLP